MRILHIVPEAPGGGTSIFIERQIKRLDEGGIVSRTIIFAGDHLSRHPIEWPRNLLRLRREIACFRPDVVHAHWGSLLGFSAVVANSGRFPLVVTFRGSDLNPVPSERRSRSAIRLACSHLTTMFATYVICVSPRLGACILTKVNSAVVPDGTDLTLFYPHSKTAARMQLGWLKSDCVVLFYAGRNSAVKRLDLACSSFEYAKERVPSLKLVVIRGDVSPDDMPIWLSAADCVLMTSDYEGSPNIVREALACNTPVVTVPVGDVERWVTGVAGTRLVARSKDALGNAIIDVVRSGERPFASTTPSRFSELASVKSIVSIYERLKEASTSV